MSPSEVLSARESPKHAPASSLLCLTICSYCSSSTRSKTASSSSILTPRPARANLSSSPASLALSAREALRLEGRPDMALSGHVRASPALVYVWGAISAHATTNLGRVRGGGRPVRAATGPPSPPEQVSCTCVTPRAPRFAWPPPTGRRGAPITPPPADHTHGVLGVARVCSPVQSLSTPTHPPPPRSSIPVMAGIAALRAEPGCARTTAPVCAARRVAPRRLAAARNVAVKAKEGGELQLLACRQMRGTIDRERRQR